MCVCVLHHHHYNNKKNTHIGEIFINFVEDCCFSEPIVFKKLSAFSLRLYINEIWGKNIYQLIDTTLSDWNENGISCSKATTTWIDVYTESLQYHCICLSCVTDNQRTYTISNRDTMYESSGKYDILVLEAPRYIHDDNSNKRATTTTFISRQPFHLLTIITESTRRKNDEKRKIPILLNTSNGHIHLCYSTHNKHILNSLRSICNLTEW